MTDRIADVWGRRTPHARGRAWPVRVDQFLEAGLNEVDVEWVQSACVLCSVDCGMEVAVKDGRIVGVRGRAEDRVNHGRLGPKGLFGWQANNSSARLTLLRRDGELQPTTWDQAMSRVVEQSQQVLAERGPLAIGFYDSGQLFVEDFYTLSIVARAGAGGGETDLYEEIAEHARAVFATLAEAVSIKEWFDVIVELPEEYHGLFPPRLA